MERKEPRGLWKEQKIGSFLRDVLAMASVPKSSAVWQANVWVLHDVLGVDKLEVLPVVGQDAHRYICIKNVRVVCDMTLPDDLPLQDKVSVLRTAIRMTHGNNNQG
jgi:hypothetical protein